MNALDHFFRKSPALLFGLLVALGGGIALSAKVAVLLPFIFFLPRSNYLRASIILLISYCYTAYFVVPPSESYTDATFTITDIRRKNTPFSSHILAVGTLASPGHTQTKVQFRLKNGVPSSNTLFFPKAHRKYSTLKAKTYTELPSSLVNLPLKRYLLKQRIKKYIHRHYTHFLTRGFLTAIFTGLEYSQPTTIHFQRCGLSHILAISGLHFTLFLSFLFYLTKLKFGIKHGALITLIGAIFLRGYYGESASILRAYEMTLFLFLAFFLNRTPNTPNLLGLALISSLLFDPLSLQSLGFQLSFTATFGLVCILPAIKNSFEKIFPTKHIVEFHSATLCRKIRYYFARVFSMSFLVNFAVTIAILPILLSTFHTYPIATFFYNLAFPQMLALGMVLFLVGCLIPGGHVLTSYYLQFVLTPIQYQPMWTRGMIHMDVPGVAALLITTLTLLYAIYSISYKRTAENPLFS